MDSPHVVAICSQNSQELFVYGSVIELRSVALLVRKWDLAANHGGVMTTAMDRGREVDTGRTTRRWRVLAAALCAALLAALMPGRYAKHEISSGFIGPVEVFAYRSPGVPVQLAGGERGASN